MRNTNIKKDQFVDLEVIENIITQLGLQYSYSIEYEQLIHNFKNPKPYRLQMTLWNNNFHLHFTIKAKNYANLLVKTYNIILTSQYDEFIELISTEK